MEARAYQDAFIENVRGHVRAGRRRILGVAPTGAGKTVVAAKMISSAFERGKRSLFLAHRKELIKQTVDKLERFGVRAGVIRADEPMHLDRAVQVASVPTLVRRLQTMPELLKGFDLVFVDEAHHHTDDNQYGTIVDFYPQAIIIGLTATPWRLDGKGLEDVYEDLVLAETPANLCAAGWLVPLGGWEFVPVGTGAAKVSKGDFLPATLEAEALKAKVVGDIVTEWKARAGGVRTILFACTVAHSMAMARAFQQAGVAAEHLDGNTDDAQRDGILRRIKSGATRVLCNVNVATEGYDCPELEAVVLARPTLSTTLYLQQVGRVLRPCEGKTRALVFDHSGNVRAHGHPYRERKYTLEGGVNVSRGAVDGSANGDPMLRRCAKCRSFVLGYPCLGCGYQPEPRALPEALAGEAVPLGETPAWKEAMAKEAARRELEQKFKAQSES
jgi:DNA repair protein RadD